MALIPGSFPVSVTPFLIKAILRLQAVEMTLQSRFQEHPRPERSPVFGKRRGSHSRWTW